MEETSGARNPKKTQNPGKGPIAGRGSWTEGKVPHCKEIQEKTEREGEKEPRTEVGNRRFNRSGWEVVCWVRVEQPRREKRENTPQPRQHQRKNMTG